MTYLDVLMFWQFSSFQHIQARVGFDVFKLDVLELWTKAQDSRDFLQVNAANIYRDFFDVTKKNEKNQKNSETTKLFLTFQQL